MLGITCENSWHFQLEASPNTLNEHGEIKYWGNKSAVLGK